MILPDQLEVTAVARNRASILEITDRKASQYFKGVPHRRVTMMTEEEAESVDQSTVVFRSTVVYESILNKVGADGEQA
jgi:hypothetical protein